MPLSAETSASITQTDKDAHSKRVAQQGIETPIVKDLTTIMEVPVDRVKLSHRLWSQNLSLVFHPGNQI